MKFNIIKAVNQINFSPLRSKTRIGHSSGPTKSIPLIPSFELPYKEYQVYIIETPTRNGMINIPFKTSVADSFSFVFNAKSEKHRIPIVTVPAIIS
jgi:hypothetical protein